MDDAPVEKGDTIEAEMTNIGQDGDPMFHYGETDFVIFVNTDRLKDTDISFTLGEEHKLAITQVEENCAFAVPSELYDNISGESNDG